jgi:hypothetical protein
MKSSTKDETKGKVKDFAGKLSDNTNLEAERIEALALHAGIVKEPIPSPMWFDDFK